MLTETPVDDSKKTVEQQYEEAKSALNAESYDKAIKLYEELEAKYPFGPYAAQSQLDIAYAYYKFREPDSAIAAADRFIKLHPRNPHIDYAYFLKGLVNYNRGIGFIERFLPIDSTQRDSGPARDAFGDFTEVVRRFPTSRYAADAKQRIVALRNNISLYEVNVARYYLNRGVYVAAVNRSKYVVEKYQRTKAVPHALKIMEEAYLALGLDDLAQDAARVYAINYGEGSTPTEYSSALNPSLAKKIWDFVGLDR